MSAGRSTPPSAARGTSFRDALVVRTIRAIEEAGPLEDAQELREALRSASTREQQVVARAQALARRIGLLDDLERLRALSRAATLACAVAVALLTWVLVGAVLGEGRRINVVIAWIGVLGPHLLSLLLWFAALLAPASTGIAGLAGGLGGLAVRAAGRPAWAGSQAPALVREGTALLREAGLLPWAFGVLNHAIWALAFVVLLGVLYVAFAFRAYELTWESTILPQAFFVDFIGTTGRLAEALQLPGADTRGVTPGEASANPRLAAWLMYCVLLYGLVPRVLLGVWSRGRWARATRDVPIEFAGPYYRRLFQRFDQLAEPVIVDPERAPRDEPAPPRPPDSAPADGAPAWIAFELPAGLAWHGVDGPASVEHVSGDSVGRQRVVDGLSHSRPAKVVVVGNGASSPDRGTARFLRDTAAHAGALALLLVGPPGDDRYNPALWITWLRSSGLGHLPVFTSIEAARAWVDAAP